MMRTIAQVHVEMNPHSPTAAEKYGGTIGRKPWPVGCKKQIGGQLIAQGFTARAQVRRADLLAGFNDEFGIEAEPAAARLAHGPKRRQIDAVLPLIVGGAAAVNAIVDRRGPPRVQIIAPFSRHASRDTPREDKDASRLEIRSIVSRNRVARMPA